MRGSKKLSPSLLPQALYYPTLSQLLGRLSHNHQHALLTDSTFRRVPCAQSEAILLVGGERHFLVGPPTILV